MRRAKRKAGTQTTSGARIFVAVAIAGYLVAAAPAAFSFPGDVSSLAVPDTTEARQYMATTIFAPTSAVLQSKPRYLTSDATGRRVKFEVIKSDDAYYMLFLNEVSGTFPVAGPGNYVIKRRLSDGAFVQAKIFLKADESTFVRIFPQAESLTVSSPDERCFLDVYVEGERINRNAIVAAPFQEVLVRSLSFVADLTDRTVDWDLLIPSNDPAEYRAVRDMVAKARAALPTLPDAEDGAMDKNGNLVFIESLVLQDQQPGFNCSGFAKWICDGLYGPATGRYLDIDVLKTKPLDVRGNRWSLRREDERDPYFGLDWSRNLAVSLLALDRPGVSLAPESADVRSVPYSRYVEDVGYRVSELAKVLYLLAVTEPGNFYIGSVNREFRAAEGSGPTLRQHVHVVVLFPYLSDDGSFHVSVMERNVESSMSSLGTRYHNDYIHLVRVRARELYKPPIINQY